MKFWATCCDNNRAVFFNQELDAENVTEVTEFCKRIISAEFHGNLCITYCNDANPEPISYSGDLCVNIGNDWNKRLQCFPVRVTRGQHNLQWMTQEEMQAVTVEIRKDFKNKAKAKEFAEAIGASVQAGAYL